MAAANVAGGHPALDSLPAAIAWHHGSVSIGMDTLIERRGRAAPSESHIEASRAKGINARRGEGDGYDFITN